MGKKLNNHRKQKPCIEKIGTMLFVLQMKSEASFLLFLRLRASSTTEKYFPLLWILWVIFMKYQTKNYYSPVYKIVDKSIHFRNVPGKGKFSLDGCGVSQKHMETM